MKTLLILGGIVANMVIGSGVWAAMDDKEQRLYRWYKDCPTPIAWLMQPIVLTAWPVGLWFWWKSRDEH